MKQPKIPNPICCMMPQKISTLIKHTFLYSPNSPLLPFNFHFICTTVRIHHLSLCRPLKRKAPVVSTGYCLSVLAKLVKKYLNIDML
jgi:hypothetical protein